MDKNSEEFKKLQEKWYGKLKKSGFEDIEMPNGGLKVWTSSYFGCRYSEVKFQSIEEYYRLARQFVYDHKFNNELEKTIWKMHADGMSIRDIAKTLKDRGIKAERNCVCNHIKAVTREMVIKCSRKQT